MSEHGSTIEAGGIVVPMSEIELTYARSSGPGGQNVNKVNSKAQLRWNALASSSLGPGQRARLLEHYGMRLTNDGELLIASDRFRDRGRNASDCIERLRGILGEIAKPPKERKATRPTKGAKRRRLDGKSHQSEKKRARSSREE